MYTTGTIGISKDKKLSLSISNDEFLSRMIFKNKQEEDSCSLFLSLKGIAYHTVLVNYIGLDSDGKIEYNKVSSMYKYEKRLRNVLFEYLSAFEEGIRAYICNNYSNNPNFFRKYKKIYENLNNGIGLSSILESMKLHKINNLVLKLLSIEDKISLFGTANDLDTNLKAIRELRNAVSHHRLLFVYEFEDCCVNGKKSCTLNDNLVNLHNHLHKHYQGFFKDRINNLVFNNNHDTRIEIPEKATLHID